MKLKNFEKIITFRATEEEPLTLYGYADKVIIQMKEYVDSYVEKKTFSDKSDDWIKIMKCVDLLITLDHRINVESERLEEIAREEIVKMIFGN